MEFHLANRAVLDRWLESTDDPELQQAVLEWINELLADPFSHARPIPQRHEVFSWVPGTRVAISYRVAMAPVRAVILVRIQQRL